MSKSKKGTLRKKANQKKVKKKAVKKATKPSLNRKAILEVLHSHSAEEKRRIPRLQLSACQFRLKRTGKIYSVHDLSSNGLALGLLDPQDLVLFPVGTEVEGMLNIKGEKYPIQAKVVYAHRTLVGCELIKPSMVLAQALQRCLDPQVLGQELKRIPSLEGKSVWYHSKTGCDLIFFGTEASDVTRIQKVLCCVLGSFIQWDKSQGLSTGSTRSAQHIPESWGLLSYETLVLSRDLKLDREKLNIAKKVVLSSNLETKLKDWCLKQFKEV